MSFKKKLCFVLLAVQVSLSAFSTETDGSALDLQGDGHITRVKLPFKYYEKQNNDQLTLIHQGGYKVYNIANQQNDVAVVGPLRPCIGIVVTDGVNLVTLHKHSTSSLESMGSILKKHLDLSNSENLYARIYTTRDDIEWNEKKRQPMHAGKTHTQEVISIKDFLENTGIIRTRIDAGLQPLRKKLQNNSISGDKIFADGFLGMYEISELCVAIRINNVFETVGTKKQIKFSSIDPFAEDIFGYKGKQITLVEYLGPQGIANIKQAHPNINLNNQPLIPYGNIPQMYFQQSGQKDGYTIQRGICERRMNQEEQELYLNYFGKTEAELFQVENEGQYGKTYNSLEFFPLS
jgi:hypothetical protein